MIIEAILTLIKSVFIFLFSTLPELPLTIPGGVFNGLNSITNGIGYVLPMAQLFPILAISFSYTALKISFAIILRIKSFIPTMGD